MLSTWNILLMLSGTGYHKYDTYYIYCIFAFNCSFIHPVLLMASPFSNFNWSNNVCWYNPPLWFTVCIVYIGTHIGQLINPCRSFQTLDFLLNIVITKKFRRRKRFDPSDSLPVVVVEMVRCEPARFKFCYLPVGVNKNSDLPCVLWMWTRPSIPVYITSIWYKKLLLWPSL